MLLSALVKVAASQLHCWRQAWGQSPIRFSRAWLVICKQ
jgi:hypothetical protein